MSSSSGVQRRRPTVSSSTTMAWSSVIGVIMVLVLILVGGPTGQAEANDTQNLNRLLNNQVIVSRQIMCVLEKSPCDQLGRQLKAALPEVIQRNCRNCSPQQAQNAQKLTNFLQTRYPEVWAMLIRKYGAV